MSEVDDFEARQAAEYGTYVANGPIYVGGALAYLEGHPVPASNVEAHKYLEQGLVRHVGDPEPAADVPEQTAYPQGDPIVIDPDDIDIEDK